MTETWSLARRRKFAYSVALGLQGATLVWALIVWALDLGSPVTNFSVALAILLSGLIGGFMLLRSGLMCAVLPFFLIGCAATFGFGTIASVMDPVWTARLSFSLEVQSQTMPMVSAAYASVGFLILAVAGPFFVFMDESETEGQGLEKVLDMAGQFFGTLLACSVVVMILMYVDFPTNTYLILSSFLKVAQGVPYLTAILIGASWHRLTGEYRVIGLVLLFFLTLLGILGFTKFFTILPLLLFGIGLALGGRYGRVSVLVILAVVAFYVTFLSEYVATGRLSAQYDPVTNTLADRLEIAVEVVNRMIFEESIYNEQKIIRRFAIVPFQSYFMGMYDAGFPGDSMEVMWSNLVPRAFWPDKPVRSPGREFDLAFRWFQTETNLAITFVGEAYWNYGWLGVISTAVIIGIQFGWFTRQWILFTTRGTDYFGAFLMAPLLIATGVRVEGEFVGTYFSGTIKLAMMLILINVLARMVSDYQRLRSA